MPCKNSNGHNCKDTCTANGIKIGSNKFLYFEVYKNNLYNLILSFVTNYSKYFYKIILKYNSPWRVNEKISKFNANVNTK